MTLHAYQTLYESSIAFGIRKALQAEQVNVLNKAGLGLAGPGWAWLGLAVHGVAWLGLAGTGWAWLCLFGFCWVGLLGLDYDCLI